MIYIWVIGLGIRKARKEKQQQNPNSKTPILNPKTPWSKTWPKIWSTIWPKNPVKNLAKTPIGRAAFEFR